MKQERVTFLQGMPVFGGLSEAALEVLLQQARTAGFEEGDLIVRQDDPPGEVYILESGRVTVLKELGERAYTLCGLARGDCIGEMSLIDPRPRSATVRAETACTAICLEPGDFYRLRCFNLQQFTILQLNIARELARRLRAVEDRMFLLMAEDGCDITI